MPKFQPTLIGYGAMLILAYLVLAHNGGANKLLGTSLGGGDKIIRALQGR